MEKLFEAKVLVNGEWIELNQFLSNEEWLKFCMKKIWLDEHWRPVVQQWENVPGCLRALSYVPDKLFELIRKSSKTDDTGQEAFMIWLKSNQKELVELPAEKIYNKFLVDYQGYFHSEEEFAARMVDDLTNIPDSMKHYFDEKRYARDLFSSDYVMIKNHVFFK